jgi:hypothetical protein
MPGKKYEKKLYIDMPFDEALERFAGTDPKEVRELIGRKKTAASKPTAANKPKSSIGRKRQP